MKFKMNWNKIDSSELTSEEICFLEDLDNYLACSQLDLDEAIELLKTDKSKFHQSKKYIRRLKTIVNFISELRVELNEPL